MKRCKGPCGLELDESEFYVKDKKTGRRMARCKRCHCAATTANYHGEKHEANKQRQREHGRKNRESKSAYMAKWRAAHPDRVREIGIRSDRKRSQDPARRANKIRYNATYRRRNADAVQASNEAYRERNRDILRLRYRAWCQANPEGYEVIRRRWRAANRATVNAATHRRRAMLRGCPGVWTAEEWESLKEAQDFTCLACGAREPEIKLTPDHVTPLALCGDNSILNLQGLCGSCNSRKGATEVDLRDEALSQFLSDLLKHGIEPGDVVPADPGIDGEDDPSGDAEQGGEEPSGAGLPPDQLPLCGNRKLWEHLNDAGRDRYAARLARHYREQGYPHYRLDDEQKRHQLQLLLDYQPRATVSDLPDGGAILTGGHALSLCWSYFPHAADVRCGKRRTPMEAFSCDRWLHAAIRRRLERGDYLSDAGVRKALRTASGVQSVSNFRPTAAMAVYGRFRQPGGMAVWDMSAGYGGRLLGAWASGAVAHYIGTDPCEPTMSGLRALRDDVTRLGVLPPMTVSLHQSGSEEFLPCANSLDLCFTSPPYFSTEEYGDEEGQSYRKFPRYSDWREGFLAATLRNCRHGLKCGGVLALNVANVRCAPTLEADTLELAAKCGFRHTETLRLGLAHLTAGGHKFEPLFLFAAD